MTTTWTVALVNPDGEPELWLTADGTPVNAAWMAGTWPSQAEASAVLLMHVRHTNVDGYRWRPVRRTGVAA